jgi:protein-disulfide isomerase
MEPDSNDRIPNFFLDNDKNTEGLNQEKSNETNSLESTPKTYAKSSKLTIHWSSLGIGAGIAIVCVFCGVLMTNMINDESAQDLDEIIINEISPTKKPTLSTFTDNASPVLGNVNAPLTMIEFGDYQCTYCKKFFSETEGSIIENYVKTGKVKILFKDFIVVGGDSANAANAAHCANDQKMFWLYHSILYNNWDGEDTGWASFERLHEFANELELDVNEFSKCMSESKWEELVNSSQADGRIIGVTATPTFFIIDQSNNILKITGAQPYAVFEEVFDSLLKKQ